MKCMYFVTAVSLQTKGFFNIFEVHSFVSDSYQKCECKISDLLLMYVVVLIDVPIDTNLLKFFRQVFYATDL